MLFIRAILFLVLIPFIAACSSTNASSGSAHVKEKDHHRFTTKKRKPVRIILDAGHGGEDKGTQSLDQPAHLEKNLTLATAFLVRDYLRKLGYYPMLTRSTDVFVPLDTRVEIAHNQRAELFVSLHYNAAAATQAHGIEVFYYNSASSPVRTDESKVLAENILEAVLAESEARNRGVKHGNFAVIRNTKIPAILIEGGFMTNSDEMLKLADSAYIDKIARGVAAGVDRFLQDKEETERKYAGV